MEFVLESIRASKNDKATSLTKEKLKSPCGICCKNVHHNQKTSTMKQTPRLHSY